MLPKGTFKSKIGWIVLVCSVATTKKKVTDDDDDDDDGQRTSERL
jgi:hypothetical protein